MNRDGSRGWRLLCGVLLVVSVAIHALAAGAESFKPFKLKTLDGTDRSLAQVLGKATLVVFFYPTCKYCNAAFPEIQKLHDAYRDRGLSVVWINVLPEEERLIADWQTKNGYTVPVLVGGRSIVNEYRVAMTPTHYLLDAQGKVLSKKAGYKSGDEKSLESAIQDALGR
jgi:thioredoxin-related protein